MAARRQLQCPGTYVGCPACGKPVFGMDLHDAFGFTMCQHKVTRDGERQNCGQHMFIHCSARFCTVVAVTAEEREQLSQGHPTRAEILRALGVQGAA